MPSKPHNTRAIIIGCGYLGSALGETLVRAGHDVVATTTRIDRTEALRDVGITPRILDIADVPRLRTALADRDAVFLTIAPNTPGADYRDTYLRAAENLLIAAEGMNVRRIIYTSSTRVYHQDDGRWVDESSPTNPTDERGTVLLETERTLLEGMKKLGCEMGHEAGSTIRTVESCATVVRLSGIYGPGRDVTRRIVAAAGTERDDGGVYVNMIHRDDIVAALTALLEHAFHGVLNLSDDQPSERCDYYDRVLDTALLPPIRWMRHDLSPKRGKRVRNEKIKDLLNLSLQHPRH